MEGDTAAPVSCLRARTGPWWIRSPPPVPVPDPAGQHCAVTRPGCLNHLRNETILPWVKSPVSSRNFSAVKRHRRCCLWAFVNNSNPKLPGIFRKLCLLWGRLLLPRMVQLHGLMKRSGVQLISSQQYQY